MLHAENMAVDKDYYYLQPESHDIDIAVEAEYEVAWYAEVDKDSQWLTITHQKNKMIVAHIQKNTAGPRQSKINIISDNDQSILASIVLSQSPAKTYNNSKGINDLTTWQGWKYKTGWIMEYEAHTSKFRNYAHITSMLTDSPIRYGSNSEHFKLTFDDTSNEECDVEHESCNCKGRDCERGYERAENVQIWRPTYQKEGDEFWYSFSFYVPKNYTYEPIDRDINNNGIEDQIEPELDDETKQEMYRRAGCLCISLFQFHQVPEEGHAWIPAWGFNKSYGGAFFVRQFPTLKGAEKRTHELIDNESFTGRWHDIVINAHWSTNAHENENENKGFMKIWVNGELKLNYVGKTRTENNQSVYFKYGLYRTISASDVEVYIDELYRGTSREDVDIRMREMALN